MNDDLDCQVTEASRAAKYSRFDGYKIGYLDGLKDALEEISDDSDSASMLGAVIVAGFASAFWFCVGLVIGWAM